MDPLFKIQSSSLSPSTFASSQDGSSDESDERTSFIRSAKSQRKYGSTTSSKMNDISPLGCQASYIQHHIQAGDTLMGIALRYHTTTECIKRINKMWNSDTLFLRESVLVPSPENHQNGLTKMVVQDEIHGKTHPILEASCEEILPDCLNSISLQPKVSLVKADSSSNVTGSTDPDQSLQDYLGSIDSQIEEAKSKAQKLQKSSEVMRDHPEMRSSPSSWSRSRQNSASSRLRVSLSDLGGEFNAATLADDSLPNATIVGATSKTSKSLFHQKDRARGEIFEL